jgi:hypothetical protein
MKRFAVAAALLATTGLARAENLTNFSLDVNGHAVAAGLDGTFGHISSGSQGGYEAGGLYHDANGASFKDLYGGLKVIGDMGVSPLKVDAFLGLRGIYLDGEGASGEAVALSAGADLRLPRLDRLVFTVSGQYSPDPLSFGDAKEYAQLDLSVGYEVLHHARLYAGYRNVGVDFGDGRHTVDNGFLGGLRLTF